MAELEQVRYRGATVADADAIGALHADSWRQHYRGVYSDSFLDGDVDADRRLVWRERLAAATADSAHTVVAEDRAGLLGFTHVTFDADPQWGALLDNLHVRFESKRRGVGSKLTAHSGRAAAGRGTPLYLWVLEANVDARAFYEACGGRYADRAPVGAPGGVAGRLTGEQFKLRIVWPDPAVLARQT